MISIRDLTAEDDKKLELVIRDALIEYGADRPGTSWEDPDLGRLSTRYAQHGCRFLIALVDGRFAGGAGIAPLSGGAKTHCELQKMYLAKEFRGLGVGKQLIQELSAWAKSVGYTYCYLETIPEMEPAIKLYQWAGFQTLSEPLGSTGHSGCGLYFGREL